MDITQLTDDAQQLFSVLPASGRITNSTGMKLTGWDYDRLIKAKYELRDNSFVEVKRAFGGPFGRLPLSMSSNPATTTLLAVAEKELYVPVQDWIRQEFIPDDFDESKDLFEVTISANRRPPTVGTWEVPDIISVSLKKYRFVPQVTMEIVSYEIKKNSDAFNVYGIFEAVSHSKFAHRSYYCFESADDSYYRRADYQRIEQEARAHGIGLIRMHFLDSDKKTVEAEEIVESSLLSPIPSAVNTLIDSFFDDTVKKRILERTGYNLYW